MNIEASIVNRKSELKYGDQMKQKIVRKRLLLLSLIGILLFVGYVAATPCSFYLPFYLPEDTDIIPSPINYTWPKGEISIVCYYLRAVIPWSEGKGVGTEIDGTNVQDPTVFMYIDDMEISNSIRTTDSYGRDTLSPIYRIRWFPVLLFGEHRAKLVIVNSIGEETKYQWTFKITFR